MILYMVKKTLFFILVIPILVTPLVFSEDEREQSPLSFYPSFSLGVGTTLDISVNGFEEKFIHGLFVYSPFKSNMIVLSLRLLLVGNMQKLQLRIPLTGTFRLFHYQWREISPFFGGGVGFTFIDNHHIQTTIGPQQNVEDFIFFFLHSGLDLFIHPHIILTIGSNLLFVGENYLDTELFLSIAFCL